jgi:hypothetical protein
MRREKQESRVGLLLGRTTKIIDALKQSQNYYHAGKMNIRSTTPTFSNDRSESLLFLPLSKTFQGLQQYRRKRHIGPKLASM